MTSGSPDSASGIPLPAEAVAPLVARWIAAGADDISGTLAAVVAQVGRARGLDVSFGVSGVLIEPSPAVLAVDVDVDLVAKWGAWLPGFVLEAARAPAERRKAGIHHTRPEVALGVVDVAIRAGSDGGGPQRVADPAVGGGAFLLAAAERLDGPPTEVVTRLMGCDIDELAVAVSRAALALWADGVAPPEENLVVADFLAGDPFPVSPDLIVGNPPFLGQLRGSTVRSESERHRLAERWPGVGRYVDAAAAFLLASLDAVTEQGAVALIQPDSFLAALDAAPVRERVMTTASLAGLWTDDVRHFEAAVDTVAVVCTRRPVAEVALWHGLPPEPFGRAGSPDADSWAPLLATRRGIPEVPPDPGGPTLGDVAHVTAGFRDEFYGLREAVTDDRSAGPRLVTSGLIDPLVNHWGRRECRYDRRRWAHPSVILDRVADEVAGWVHKRLRPKVLVASQTRVIEAVADPLGDLVPCTPVVSVEPTDAAPTVWHLAAVLTCPVATARIAHVATGSALHRDALRITASRLADLPLPADCANWDRAAASAERGDITGTGRLMLAAHGLEDRHDLYEWWRGRLPGNEGADRADAM